MVSFATVKVSYSQVILLKAAATNFLRLLLAGFGVIKNVGKIHIVE